MKVAMSSVVIADKTIGDGSPVFITLEAGPTHNGVESAKRLVNIAHDSGADAIKFQILDADRLVRDPDMMVGYGYMPDRASGLIEQAEEPLRDVLRRRSLTRDEWRSVKEYADELGIIFFATVSYQEEIDFVVELGCPSIKIASLDVNHIPLLREAARHDLCLQLDTGNATIGEIEQAIDLIAEAGNNQFIIHQCPSGYPARLESINLRAIPTLKMMFGYPVAFSDHTPGWEMDIAAIALGACLIEKTITEDKTQRSPEHVMSLEPHEVRAFVQAIRDLEIALGGSRRKLTTAEADRRAKRRRSAFLLEDVRQGQVLGDVAIDFARPGHGLAPDEFERFRDWQLTSDLPAGHLLKLSDLAARG